MNNLTVVMYHYVRDFKNSRYRNIKGIDILEFKGQLEYMKKYYQFITMQECFAALYDGYKLPNNSILLTFDDGYLEHYTNVFPVLDELKLQGSFFIPAKAIENKQILDVNKIHFILSEMDEKTDVLLRKISDLLVSYTKEYKLKSEEYYWNKLAIPNRFDSGEIIYIKRLLQVELPEKLRNIITNLLFEEFVCSDEKAFASELYMNEDQLKCMNRNGMYIGNHGYDHYWLNSLDSESQESEIIESLRFLKKIGSSIESWAMCYPYGAYNDSLVEIIKKHNCKIGFSTKVDIAYLEKEKAFELPRLDTKDLPMQKNAEICNWTHQIF